MAIKVIIVIKITITVIMKKNSIKANENCCLKS